EWNVYRLDHLIGLPVDTTFALSRLALGGFFDKYPNLKVIAAHVGGAVPFLIRRIERAFREGKSQYKPSHYFGQLFYDTAGPTDEAIVACVARMFGSEQIVFGTDYPFGLGQEGKQYIEHAVEVVQDSGLSESDLAKIYGGNARPLFRLDAQDPAESYMSNDHRRRRMDERVGAKQTRVPPCRGRNRPRGRPPARI